MSPTIINSVFLAPCSASRCADLAAGKRLVFRSVLRLKVSDARRGFLEPWVSLAVGVE